MSLLDAIFKGITSRALPQAKADNAEQETRLGRYGELYALNLIPDYYEIANEGTYFVGTTPTIGTGIALGGAAITSFNDTTGAGLCLQNSDQASSAAGGKRISIDYIKLVCTTLITGTITTPFFQLAGKTDNLLSRYTSGGTQITPVNPNEDVSNASVAKLFFGALTLAAASSAARTVFRNPGRGAAAMPGVNDVFVINFGGVEKAISSTLAAAVPAVNTINAPPVILGPQGTFSLHSWAPGQTAAAVFELEMGWWER